MTKEEKKRAIEELDSLPNHSKIKVYHVQNKRTYALTGGKEMYEDPILELNILGWNKVKGEYVRCRNWISDNLDYLMYSDEIVQHKYKIIEIADNVDDEK